MKESIAISYDKRVPKEWVNELAGEVEDQNFKVKKLEREDEGLWAAFEWAIPTLAVAMILKPFFQAFMSEAGKDAYKLAKSSLKKFILKNREIKLKMIAATSSVNKLSKGYDQSLSISVKAQIHQGLSVTVLFNEKVPDEEAPEMVDTMFEVLEGLYERFQKERPDDTDQWSRNNIYLMVNYEKREWEMLTEKQVAQKYRNQNKSEVQPISTITTMSEVFISYSWDNEPHEQKVIDLTNHLRTQGFNASIDKMISQQKTAINFVKMMHQALLEHPKVIVILSKGYKEKAENFKGGVGEEYEILINDIKKNERKYILASFSGRGEDIVPLGLAGRDIVDLSQSGELERLYSKLLDHEKYQFVPVGGQKPILPTIPPQQLTAKPAVIPVIALSPRVSPTGNAGSTGDKYRDVELVMDIELKNQSTSTVSEFGVTVKFPKSMIVDRLSYKMEGDLMIFEKQFERKLFAGQTISAHQLKFDLDGGNIHRLFEAEIIVEIFTEAGSEEQRFVVKDIVRLKPPGKHWMEPEPLTRDMFIN